MDIEQKISWIFDQHEKTNHLYDNHPYSYHLEMVADELKWAIENAAWFPEDKMETILLAAYGHDLIEDTRVTYNDVKDILGEETADIIYAVTNEKGKTRSERANDKYYEGIRANPLAVIVKLADRVANVTYSKNVGSSMFNKYKKENENFLKSLGIDSMVKPVILYAADKLTWKLLNILK